jgi:hypothetical protein
VASAGGKKTPISRREKAALMVLNAIEPTCGHCRWWRRVDEGAGVGDGVGECTFNPPTVIFDTEANCPMTVWPIVMADDTACSHFKGSQ